MGLQVSKNVDGVERVANVPTSLLQRVQQQLPFELPAFLRPEPPAPPTLAGTRLTVDRRSEGKGDEVRVRSGAIEVFVGAQVHRRRASPLPLRRRRAAAARNLPSGGLLSIVYLACNVSSLSAELVHVGVTNLACGCMLPPAAAARPRR